MRIGTLLLLLASLVSFARAQHCAADSVLACQGTSKLPAPQTKRVLDARDFGTSTGSNAGTLIQAAHNSTNCSSTTGCVIDARGFGATDTIAGLSITKPVCIEFGATTFSVTATMTWKNVAGPCVQGSGQAATIFNWAGSSSNQMFRLISVQRAVFRNFKMVANTSVPATAFITSERGASGNPTGNAFYDITGEGTNGGVTNGFNWVVGAGGDAGNDSFRFYNVQFYNYSNAAWNNSTSTQAQSQSFFGCSCDYGQYCYYGIGSVAFYNTTMGGNTVSDFVITGANNGVLISGGVSIGSARLYGDASGNSNAMPVTIEGVNWANNAMNASGYVITIGLRGPYFIANNQISGSQSLPSQFLNYGTGTQNLIAIGNNIWTNLANPFTGGRWELIGNSINTGPPTLVPDAFPNPFALSGHLNQHAAGNWAGTCAMSGTTTCTIALTTAYTSTPGCVVAQQGTGTVIAGECSVSGTTVTITAASTNSATWAAMLFGNPN